jgi:predicted HAD superfamily Cof-like phosphohydrolase
MLTREQIKNWDNSYYQTGTKNKSVTEMVQEFASVTGQSPTAHLYASLIQEEYDEWQSEYLHNTKGPQLKELADLVYVVYGYASGGGWDLEQALQRVHENNLGRCVQDDGTILRSDEGKIIKNPKYHKVNLEDLV